jgi:iron complex outermembrane recepter protein
MKSRLLGAAAACGLLFLWSGAGYAQSVSDGIEEVTVTAEKRPENIQNTPVSITAFTAEDIARAGIVNFADDARMTPGLQYGDFGDIKLSPTSLRGIVSSSGSAGADPAVGFYVDEIYEGQGAGANLDLYDIERVEVLRGPQGTLFGRNTIGGVVSITTEKPSDELKASASIDLGNYASKRFGGSISGPIVDGIVDGKLSAVYDKRNGFEHNVLLNNDVNDHFSWSGRGQLLFKFNPDTELLLTAAYNKVDQHPLVFETKAYNNAALLPNLLDAYGLPRNLSPYDRKVYSDTVTHERLNAYDYAAHFTTRLGDIGVTNITSYHRHDYYSRDDTDRSPLKMAYDGDPEKVWRLSEEFRLDFSTGDIDWLTGLYYFRQNSDNQSFIEIGPDLANLFGAPSISGLITGSNGVLDTTSLAGFASGTWHATDALDVTVGARYTSDHKKIHYLQSDPVGLLGGNADIRASDTWNRLTPNFNARYRFTEDFMGYVTVSQGFKSGGFNDGLGDANGIGFGPESLTNYEGGVKTDWFGRRLVFDAAVFDMEWKKIQITIDNPKTPIYDPSIYNAGAAHSRGVELELTALPVDALLISANLSIQDVKYDEGTLPTGQPLNHIPYAPAYTANINAQYTIPVDGIGDLALYGEYLMRGRSYLTPDNQADGRVDPYGLLNARLSLTSTDERWSITLWGKNLTNEIYEQRLFDLSTQDLVGQKFIVLGDPRTVGIELKVKY